MLTRRALFMGLLGTGAAVGATKTGAHGDEAEGTCRACHAQPGRIDIIVHGNADERTLAMMRQEIAASEARMQRDLAADFGHYRGRWTTLKAG